jgi:cytochrome P450
MMEGDRVAMFYPSANRDEAHFVDPDRFDVTRKPNPHLAFGGGGTHSASARTWPVWRRLPSYRRC